MKKLGINLEHCYGIRKLQTEFDFERYGDVFAIYAPNGTMKTSFAKAFKDLSEGKISSDRIWTNNETKRQIEDENRNGLAPENVFVIEPYNDRYRSDRVSTLLANDELRKQYDAIHIEINKKVSMLVEILKPYAGSKTNITEEIATSITHDPKGFFLAITRVKDETINKKETPLGDVVYSDIFNPKVELVLESSEFKDNIKNYMEKYDELMAKSTFFKKGVFTHNNADDVAKSLDANGFFKANHSIFLRINGKKTEIGSLKDLKDAIQNEKESILTDTALQSAFGKIDDQLKKNADLRNFRTCLENNPIVLTELDNPGLLRQNLWIEYLIRAKETYLELLNLYTTGKNKIDNILVQAKNERTRWDEVISIFNERFSVPFVARIDNQEDVILKKGAPVITFDFLEDSEDIDSDATPVGEDLLMDVLSNGESRALYILNIIFEVEARKTAMQNTLFIVDDIADSFDYKNKYAIIEYLMEIKEFDGFQEIIMSHNFDFYRTISSRLRLRKESKIVVSKESREILFQEDEYQPNPFSHWRTNLTENSVLIAVIPFIRNLAEFSGDSDSRKKLTSLLHIKMDTDKFLVAKLEDLIKTVLHDQEALTLEEPEKSVKDLIYKVGEEIATNTDEESALENKITLSIAIRLKAEEFMIAKINDHSFWENIKNNQTIILINRFKNNFPMDKESIQILDQVNLMTPENIHLNSFMYEPILDLSAGHLKRLFLKVFSLEYNHINLQAKINEAKS